MSIKKGDFLLFDYTCKVKENNEIIDTTIKEVAEKNSLDKDKNASYEPLFAIVGERWLVEGLDEGLKGLEIGKQNTIEISPEKAYGVRDPSKIRLIPLRKFRKDGIDPIPGLPVTIDKKTAYVRSVGAGRVQVDFNHPLAGKTLIYDIKPEKIIKTDDEKIRAIIHKQIPMVKKENFLVNIQGSILGIEIPVEAFYIEGIQYIKRALSTEITKYLPNISKVMFIESFERPKIEKVKTEEKQEKAKTTQKGKQEPSKETKPPKTTSEGEPKKSQNP